MLFSQRDLLEARVDLIETKQQQLSAIVNAYQALGGGYLLTSQGLTYKDIRCLSTPYLPGEVIDVPVPEDAQEELMPNEDSLPPLPSEAALSATTLDSIES